MSRWVVTGAAAVSLCAAGAFQGAAAEDGGAGGATLIPGRVSYDKGLKLSLGDGLLDAKLNTLIKSSYIYNDYDETSSLNDDSSFESRLIRIILSGDAADKQFSYLLQNDFIGRTQSNTNDKVSDLKDAWVQWNLAPEAKLRFGQMKVPYSRSNNVSDSALQLTNRPLADKYFGIGRSIGAMAFGAISDSQFEYFGGVYNGISKDSSDYAEGTNRTGIDPNVMGVFALDYSSSGYGKRSEESDFKYTEGFEYTVGVSAIVDEGEQDSETNYHQVKLGGDIGARAYGASFQSEVYSTHLDVDGEESAADDVGFYVQGGYFVVREKLEVVGVASFIFPDDSMSTADKITQYGVGIDYYLMGNTLKFLNLASWQVTDPVDPALDSTTNFSLELMLQGYF